VRTERLLIDTVILLLLGIVLFAVGWLAAPTIFETAVRASGLHELVYESREAVTEPYPGIALALAIAAPLAWIVGLAYRIGAHRPPRVAMLAATVAVLFSATIFGMVRVVWWITDSLQSEQEIRPMINAGDFQLGSFGAGMACRVALLLGVIAFAIGRRAHHR